MFKNTMKLNHNLINEYDICVMCLSHGRTLKILPAINDFYNDILHIKSFQGASMNVCWECEASHNNFKKFCQNAISSHEILLIYSEKYPDVKFSEIITQNKSNLQYWHSFEPPIKIEFTEDEPMAVIDPLTETELKDVDELSVHGDVNETLLDDKPLTYEITVEATNIEEPFSNGLQTEERVKRKTRVSKKYLKENTDTETHSPIPIKKRQTWNTEAMSNAVIAVRTKKMGAFKASKTFNVPRSTLRRMVKRKDDSDVFTSARIGRKPTLHKDLEHSLIRYMDEMRNKLFGLTKRDVRSLAYQIAVKNNISHTFSTTKESAGRRWMDTFLSRHPEIKLEAHVKGFSEKCFGFFFDVLEELLRKHNFSHTKIFNVNAEGFRLESAEDPEIRLVKGNKQFSALRPEERKLLITCISCISSGGEFVPPMFIIPRNLDDPLLVSCAPPGTIHAIHPSGWVQKHHFTQWLLHFIAHVKPDESSPVLLILDGHSSYTNTIDLIDMANENYVHLLSAPAASDKFQPIGLSLFAPLIKNLKEEIRVWQIENKTMPSQTDLIDLFSKAYIKVQSPEIAYEGFKNAGIWPYNRKVICSSGWFSSDANEESELSDSS